MIIYLKPLDTQIDNAKSHWHNNNNTASFKAKTKNTGRIGNDGTKNVEIRVQLKYLSNFWTTLEMLLINCEIKLN